MKRLLCVFFALAMACVMCAASADPMLTHRGNIVWLGERNYLYLRDTQGTVKQLPSAIANLVGMDEDSIYCMTASGRLYAVRLDGSASSIVSSNPSQEELLSYRINPPYELTDGALTLISESGEQEPIADHVEIAAAGNNAVYYVTEEGGRYDLRAYALPGGQLYGFQIAEVNEPVCLTVSLNAVALLDVNGNIFLENIQTGEIMNVTSISDAVKVAAYVDDQLFQYQVTPEGNYETLHVDKIPFTGQNLPVTEAPSVEPSVETAQEASAEPAPQTYEAAPVTPTPDPSDKTIYLGDQGSKVRRMQQRLFDLGYPVGRVDGVYGDDTAYAVNLFQSATGASEHSYMTEKTQNDLFSVNAPAYDPYMPLMKGDRGVRVRQLQTALNSLGYEAGNVDGVYGDSTAAAVASYQIHIGEVPAEGEISGEVASRNLLINLYNELGGKPVVTNEPEEKQTPSPEENETGEASAADSGTEGEETEADPEPTRTKRPIRKQNTEATATPAPTETVTDSPANPTNTPAETPSQPVETPN